MKHKVIIDTNFLLIPGQFKVDIFSEIKRILDVPFELCVVQESIDELNKLVLAGKVSDRMAAKLGLVLVRQKHLKTLRSFILKKNADDAIVSKSDENTFIATQDKALRARLREKGAKIIALRQKKYLVVI